jgi:hypothetical protein
MSPRIALPKIARYSLIAACQLACGHSTEQPASLAHPGALPPFSGATARPSTKPNADASTTSRAPSDATAADQAQDPNATSTATPTPAAAWDPGLANLNPDDDGIVGPPDAIEDCEARLRAANVTFRLARLPILRRRGMVCGAPQVVEYLEGPEHIRFYPHPVVTCQLALGLAHFERVVERVAAETLGARVISVTQGGTYSCRSMARFKLVSEHSYANAIDIYSFGLSDGQTVSVQKHFGRPSDAATTRERKFLRTIGQRLFDEDVFSVVVTRYFDEIHRDHIHVDMAHYRTDGSR